MRVGYRELRKLRQLSNSGDVTIEADYVIIGEETIPLSPDHTEDLQAAIESILEAKNKAIEDQAATIRAKDKVLKDKEKLVNKHARRLAELENTAEKNGYTPGEEKLMQNMDNARTIIDGLLMEFDPERNPLPEDATPRMCAKLMHTLDYFKRVVIATYDTAADIYGTPEMDDDWVPPHLRSVDKDGHTDPPLQADCATCDHHKGMSNAAKGVKIPGEFGKCTRPGGLCESHQEA